MLLRMLVIMLSSIISFSVTGLMIHYGVFESSMLCCFVGMFIGWASYAVFIELQDKERMTYDV